ncbi:MAG: pterin-binding domain-containing protein [Desulfobulbaceae bacterium]
MTGNTATSNSETMLTTDLSPGGGRRKLLVVAEGLHVLNQQTSAAITGRNREALLALARQHLACGAQALAVNLGPSRAMAERTEWVTETLCRDLAVPLFLSANGLAFPQLLSRFGRRLTINAVTADPAALRQSLATAKEFGTGLVVLLVSPGLTPSGSADRLALASMVIDQALQVGFPLRQLYLDPLLTLRPDPLAWRISRGLPDLGPVADTIDQLRQLDDSLRTIVALGNCAPGGESSGHAGHQARVLAVLIEAGLDAVILNGRNQALLSGCQDLAGGSFPRESISRAA